MIKGIQPLTLVDYPGYIACILFCGGCNMKCPYCYNGALAKNDSSFSTIDFETVSSFLLERADFLDAVVISGGEPTLYGPKLVELIEMIKGFGLLVKLDTNGTNPQLLRRLLPLVDYVALDVKTCEKKYYSLLKKKSHFQLICESIELLKMNFVDYEFRTTVVDEVINMDDVEALGELVNGGKRLYLQPFVPLHTLDKSFMEKESPNKNLLHRMRNKLLGYVDDVQLRL